jgi:CHAD domain-containing protein
MMTAMAAALERERKFKARKSFDLARVALEPEPYAVAPATRKRLHTTYYDTADLRLTRWGISLRFRVGESWTVKLPEAARPSVNARTEHTFPGEAGRIPERARDLVAAFVRGAELEPVAELRTIRTRRPVSFHDDDVGEIVADDVRVVREHIVADRFRQIEIELRPAAPDAALDKLSRAVRRAGAGRPDPQPKIAIALGRAAHTQEIRVPVLHANARAGTVVRAALAANVVTLIQNDPHLRVDPTPESIHTARVRVRKLRSALKTFRPLLDETWAGALRDRLRWLNDALSGARDADVVLAGITQRSMCLPDGDRENANELLQPLRERRDAAYAALGQAIRTPHYINLIDELIAAAQDQPLSKRARTRAARVLPALMRRTWRRLRKAVYYNGATPHDRDLHRIRIKAKHVRFAAEALAPIGGRGLRQLEKRAERLQTILGEQHDAVMAIGILHGLQQTPLRAFLSGELSADEEETAAKARRRWHAAWKRARRTYRLAASS